jgi:hypothetical protein
MNDFDDFDDFTSDDFDDIPLPIPQGDRARAPESVPLPHMATPLADIPEPELIDLHEAIKSHLPPHRLQDLDLAQELVLQFLRVKHLQAVTLENEGVKTQQKAQVANSVAAVLSQLTKMQTELSTAERFKALEGMLIKALKKLPLEVAEAFLEEYAQMEYES